MGQTHGSHKQPLNRIDYAEPTHARHEVCARIVCPLRVEGVAVGPNSKVPNESRQSLRTFTGPSFSTVNRVRFPITNVIADLDT